MNTLATVLAAEESSGSPLGILILIIPFGLLIWLMVVPQRKQKARQQQMMSSLSVGDEVMTTGGIVGQVTFLEDDLAHLEIDHDVVIRVAKSAIARSMAEPDPAAAPARSRGGLLGGLMGGGASADTAGDDAVDVRPSKSSGSGVGTARSGAGKGAAKAGSRKK
ncbi:preprotein translocase subunit YajC [Dermatobacter hominis]|uniref:preprotein translocase subunit YajC n=1 Tax=Dermatobacter hominis TaxID=2884263 RepID=UPI001D12718A|nr:preprotein translocase subunit YajC [Dermatobacter hominis]UDY36164.1 preprotein translocase subunit YajC [Dermatobacter hominis]